VWSYIYLKIHGKHSNVLKLALNIKYDMITSIITFEKERIQIIIINATFMGPQRSA